MSSLALMRLLEAGPLRYDAGMRALTLGRVDCLHELLAASAAPRPGARVLEIGCGTGSVTARLVARGARVTALDQSPEMLELARSRLAAAPPHAVEWLERTASEIDALPASAYDAVVASLVLSDMSAGERAFVLRESARRLRPGGVIAVGDEVAPRRPVERALQRLLRGPQAAVAWLAVGSVSHPIRDLAGELRAAGFAIRSETRWLFGSLAAVIGEVPA
jgi:demethylmenaquinone methyltransferase/2-methoxy-6-polyprenyl-1,4-benzoquinol methylase